jgi:hypothetical protein
MRLLVTVLSAVAVVWLVTRATAAGERPQPATTATAARRDGPPEPPPEPEGSGSLPAAARAATREPRGMPPEPPGPWEDPEAGGEPLTREETSRIRARLERVMFLASGALP